MKVSKRLAVRLLVLPSVLLLVGLALGGCSEDLPRGAIARVGQQLIPQSELEELISAYESAGRAPDKDQHPDDYRRFEQKLARYLITLEVIRQEAPSLDVSVTEQEVESRLEQIRRMFLTEEAFEKALKAQGLTLEQLTRSVRDRLWLDAAKAAVTGDATVTEEEAQVYYEAHKADYVEQESREVRHILISPFRTLSDGKRATTASQDEWDAAGVEAEKVRSQIQNGADFATMAEEYSDDETTRESGGELGAVVRGVLVPDLEEAVFSLELGELSQPIKTDHGYHIVQVTDIIPERQLAFEQVKERIRAALLEEKQAEAWQQWLAQAESRLGVEYLADYRPSSEEPATSSGYDPADATSNEVIGAE